MFRKRQHLNLCTFVVKSDLNNIAHFYTIGRFYFPAVLENGNEWMTVTPNEVETMKEAISQARGRVAAYGLGLGYFAFMASEKSDVTGVTVIERDEQAIRLFEEEILPQFPHRRCRTS